MKTRFLISSFILLNMILAGCSSSGIGLPGGTGWPYEVVVVMSQPNWDAQVGEAVRDELEAAVPFLPQPEAAMRLTKVTPQVFDGILHYAKNIMLVNVDDKIFTKVSLKHETNKWAQNQVVLTMNAPDEASVVEYLKDKKGVLVEYFTKAEMDRAVRNLDKEYNGHVMKTLQEKFAIRMNVPTDMEFYRDTTGFFWTSNNANRGRIDMIAYSFPYTDTETFTLNYLVNKRDSVLRENLPGAHPNSYMATELRGGIDYKDISHLGKYGGVMRGLWKMMGDMMGGPFVSLSRVDEENNQVIVVECFVYAPESEKKNLIRRGEASLYTLRLPGEYEIPLKESLSVGRKITD